MKSCLLDGKLPVASPDRLLCARKKQNRFLSVKFISYRSRGTLAYAHHARNSRLKSFCAATKMYRDAVATDGQPAAKLPSGCSSASTSRPFGADQHDVIPRDLPRHRSYFGLLLVVSFASNVRVIRCHLFCFVLFLFCREKLEEKLRYKTNE